MKNRLSFQIVIFLTDFYLCIGIDSYIVRMFDNHNGCFVRLLCRDASIFVEVNDYETLVSGIDFSGGVIAYMDRTVIPCVVSESDIRTAENKPPFWVANAVSVVDIDIALSAKVHVKVLQNVVV